VVSEVNTRLVFVFGKGSIYPIGMNNRLRELRERAKLTQKELAKKMGTQQAQIDRWEKQPDEKGYRRIPLPWARKAVRELHCMLWEVRPDVLTDESVDLLLEGAPPDVKKDVIDYAIFKLEQRR
jgi:transcriptional regulator with XRE-family HTH domain